MISVQRTHNSRGAGRDGFALPAVIMALVVMSIVAIAAVRLADDERRAARSIRESAAALYAAEAGISEVLETVTDTAGGTTLDSIAQTLDPGDSADLGTDTLPDGAQYSSVLLRVDGGSDPLYLLTVEGRDAVSRGARQVSVLLEPGSDGAVTGSAAVMTSADIELASDASTIISGNDAPPPGWGSCPAAAPPVAGALVASMTGVQQGPGTIAGSPPLQLDPSSDASTFGDYTYADLAALAEKTYAPGSSPSWFAPVTSGGKCDTGVMNNWGAPRDAGHPCADYFPIIHFLGNVEFTTMGSAGQGILLVDGDLAVGGGDFTFYGLIMVRGACVFEYQSTVYGAVQCANPSSESQEIGDDARLNYSTCALAGALSANGLLGGGLQPIGQRAWSEVRR